MKDILAAVTRLQRLLGPVRLQARRPRRLRMIESVPLGEKRFAAILQVDGQQFLVGGGSGSVSLLAQLGAPAEHTEHPFAEILEQRTSIAPFAEAAAR